MFKQTTCNRRTPLRFKRFSHRGYALFSVIGKEVLIGTLSVSTLAHAKASGISTKTWLAADTAEAHQQTGSIDEVVVNGSRAPLSVRQSATLVEVITREDIERAEASTINDVLKLATGVDVRQRGGFGVQTDISINGGTFDQMTLLLNGVNVSNPQTGHNAADIPVSLHDIERVEIIEGAASRMFGASAFSGAINIVTRQPTSPTPTGKRTTAYAALEGGSYGTVATEGGAHTPLGLLSGGYTRSDGGTENSDFEKGRAFASARWGSRRVALSLQGGMSTQSYGANTFYSAKYANQYEKTDHVVGSATAAVSDLLPRLTIQPTAYVNGFRDHYQLLRGMGGAANGENYHRLWVYGLSLDLHYRSLLGQTVIGADLHRDHLLSTAYGQLQPESRWHAIGHSDRQYDKRATRTHKSLYAEHNVVLRQWTLSAGMFYNRVADHSQLAPGIDIAFRPDRHWKVCASWNQAMRLPTFTDLYAANAVQQGDPQLKPERNTTVKLGMQGRWTLPSIAVGGSLSAFHSHGTDMIDWVFLTAEDTRYQALNIGKLDNTGFSVTLSASEQTARRQHSRWKAELGYAYIHQHHSTGQPIYRSLYALEYLRHKLTAKLSHDLPQPHTWQRHGQLRASWAMRWQQRMNGYHPYTKIDVKLSWDSRRYQLYLKADNLTAHRYYDLGSVLQPGLWLMAGATVRLSPYKR